MLPKLRQMVPYLFTAPPPYSQENDEPWREIDWRESKQMLLTKLNDFQPGNPEVDSLRILLHGPVGAGKSSFINTVDSIFQGRITTRALAQSANEGGEGSFTLECKTYKQKKRTPGTFYPFTFIDIMGIETAHGIQTDDINKILHGHIITDYTFNAVKPISEEDPMYNKNPSLKDKIHCLVSVLPANTISEIKDEVFKKMRDVRENARRLDIPQAIIMTKVDEVCPRVKKNLEKVYRSKRIQEKMEVCSVKLGVPVSYIFPVKNYHNEHHINTAVDILSLSALESIVNFGNDYVVDQVVHNV